MKKQKGNRKIWFGLIIIGITAVLLGVMHESQINELENQIENKNILIDNLFNNLTELKTQCSAEKEQIALDYNLEMKELQEKISNSRLINFNPTLQEVKKILREDDTERKKYIDDTFNCVDFSNRLIQEFLKRGIFACKVTLYFDDGAHAIVSVDTSDYGIIYIEPQDDEIINVLSIGEDYCDIVNWNCEWKIEQIKSCFDDLK